MIETQEGMRENSQTVKDTAILTQDVNPDQAVSNIENSDAFELTPDEYKDLSPFLTPDLELQKRIPAQLSTQTAKFITEDTQQAAATKGNESFLDSIEKKANYFVNKSFTMNNNNRKIVDLRLKELDVGLTEDEQDELFFLNQDNANILASRPEDVSNAAEITTDVIGAVYDIARSFTDNPEALIGGAATGAAGGAVAGTVLMPGIGTAGLATTGAFLGAQTAVGLVDSYRQTKGLTYNSLMTAGENITSERADSVSEGVALLSGATGGVLGFIGGKTNPLVKKLTNPAQLLKIVGKNPKLLAKLDAIGSIATGMFAEGTEETIQGYIQKVGEKFALNGNDEDDAEAVINNLLESAKMNEEELKEIGYEGLIGAAAGGTIRSATTLASYKDTEARYQNQKKLAEERNVTLEFQKTIQSMHEDFVKAEGNGLAKAVKDKFIDKTFSALDVDRTLFLDAEAMQEFANTPEKQQALDTLVATQEFNETLRETGGDFQVTVSDLFKSGILNEYPEVTEDIKPNAKGETPAQIKANVEEFIRRQDEANIRRQEILNEYTEGYRQAQAALDTFVAQIDGEPTPEQQATIDELAANVETASKMNPETEAELEALNAPIQDPQPYDSEFDYLDDQTFQEIPGVLTQEEADQLNQKDMLEVKMNVAQALNTEVDKEFDRLVQRYTAQELKDQIKHYENDVKILDSFAQKTTGKLSKNKDNSEAARNAVSNHKQKGYSPSAIDPNSLSEYQKEVFMNNPEFAKILKKRKVFVEGGIHIEESAIMNGVDDGDKLLDILVGTPNKSDIRKLKEQQKIAVENEARQLAKPLREERIRKEFGDRTKIYKKQLDEFRGKSWNILKRGIIKINKDPVNIKEMQSRAKDIVNTIKISNLQPNAFRSAERRNKRLANKALLEGKPEQAYTYLEKAYLNHELKAEATKAQLKIEKNKNFWKKMKNNKVAQATLQKSGHLEAMQELYDLINLDGKDPTKKQENELAAFSEFVRKQYSEGNYNITIPDRLRTTSTSIKDISFEQYDKMTQAAQNVLKHSRRLNKLDKKVNDRLTALSLDELREQVRENAEAHPDYNPERSNEDYEESMGLMRRALSKSTSIVNHIGNINWLNRELDAEKKDGFFYNHILYPMELAKDRKSDMTVKLVKDMEGVVKKFYGSEKKFLDETSKYIPVPELANFDGIADKDGNIRVSELMVLQAYRGDENYYQDIANYKDRDGRKMSVEEMEEILDKYLDENQAAFVQEYLVDPFTRYSEELVALEKRFNDNDLELAEPRSFVHRGRVMKGGYYPGRRKPMTVQERARREQAKNDAKIPTLPGEDPYDFSQRRALERTKQSHVKQRTGSERAMVLDIANIFKFHEEISHDLAFRETGKQVIDFVTDDVNAEQMINILGKGKYETLVNSVKDVISKDSEKYKDTTTGRFTSMLQRGWSKLNSLHAISRIGLSATSILSQGASLITAAQSLGLMRSAIPLGKGALKAGASGAIDVAKSVVNTPVGKKLLHHRINQAINDVTAFDGYMEYAKEINPDIQREQDGIDDNVIRSLGANLVNASNTKNEQKRKYDNITKEATNFAFAGLQQADNTIRGAVTLAIADMFYAGKYEGYSIDRVNSMTEAEQKAALKKIVKIETRSTLTASSRLDKTLIEKSDFGKLVVRYWTDLRNVLNLMLSQGRDVRNQWKDKNYRLMVNRLATMQVSAMMMEAYLDAINPYEEEEDPDATVWDDVGSALGTIPRVVASATPFVSMAMWAADKSPWARASVPALDISNRVIKGFVSLPDAFLEDETVSKKELDNIIHATMAAANLPGAKAISLALKETEDDDVDDIEISPNAIIGAGVEMMGDMLNYFIEELPEEYEPVKEEMRKDLEQLPQDPESVKGLIDVDTIDNMAFALSENNWRKVDEETGAAGIYQFTEERWNTLMETEPDLGLTESGRIEKDPAEQERAMDYLLRENAATLNNYGQEINDRNLLGSHIFGVDEYLDILAANDGDKLTKILGADLAKQPPYNKFKTVKELKNYLSKLLTN